VSRIILNSVDAELSKYTTVVALIPSLESDKLELIKCKKTFELAETKSSNIIYEPNIENL
jgi:hypothetical protein